jgi:molecular chaperone DnaK (HSP70)
MSTDSGGARLGVDLGTTWTAAAVTDRAGTRPLMLGDSGPAMPSVVAFENGTVLVGDAAERRLLAEPSSGVREPKRRLGDTTPYVVGGTPYGADTLMGHLLGQVVAAATTEIGSAPTSVVLTHPANWGEYKLDLLREAARIADVGNVELSSEPEAAARHYVGLGRVSVGDAVAVYDFGGGTFDVAVVRCGQDGTEVLGTPEGLERLGGLDLDQAVLAHVDAALDGQLSELDTADPTVRSGVEQLRIDCTRAKEALSVDSEAVVAVRLPGLVTEIRMTRDEFEGAIRARLADTLTSLDRALESADIKADDLAGLLMVGGSSRIPLVTELVSQHTDRPVLTDADAKLVVALGASGAAALETDAPPIISGQETDMADKDSDAGTDDRADQSKSTGGATSSTSKVKKVSAKEAAAKKKAASGQGKDEKKDKKGRISAKGAAAGVAGVAAAAAVVGGGVAAADAFTGGGDDDGLDEDAAPPPEDTMDAFDDAAPAEGGAAGGGGGASRGGGGGGAGGGGGGGRTPSRAARRSSTADDDPGGAASSAAGSTTTAPPPDRGGPADSGYTADQTAEIDAVRAQLRERLANLEPPEGADPAEMAELRAELEGLLDRFQPLPGQSLDDAVAALRADFDDQVKDFTQDQKIDALIEDRDRERAEQKALQDGVDSARTTLEERLAAWEPPAGTDPAAAAELKAELAAILENYVPVPGSTVDQAVADIQERFENEVKDFAQDQKIDALVGEESTKGLFEVLQTRDDYAVASMAEATPDPAADQADVEPDTGRTGALGGLRDTFDDLVFAEADRADGQPAADGPDVGKIVDPIRAEYVDADAAVGTTGGEEPEPLLTETGEMFDEDVLGGDLVTADVTAAPLDPVDVPAVEPPGTEPDLDPRLTTTADDLLGRDDLGLDDAIDEPDPLLEPEFDTIGTEVPDDQADEGRAPEPADEPVDDQPDDPTFT